MASMATPMLSACVVPVLTLVQVVEPALQRSTWLPPLSRYTLFASMPTTSLTEGAALTSSGVQVPVLTAQRAA